ncbi:enoyl-CoA hydratase/isomerase family protein [Mycolicibacterium peregrinum]|uniref:enoyl-CoA hydratase/isomerase family protein n=1 Tax=Mycolicibacterium TaxID=1866885 RepID=UPI003AAAC148
MSETTNSGVIPHIPLDQYKEAFAPFFNLDRSESGVLVAQMHTNGDSVEWGKGIHRALHQLTTLAAQDFENEVFIIGGTGENFIGSMAEELTNATPEEIVAGIYDHVYYDGAKNCEGLVTELEVPTIGVLNGPGFHTEIALLCDITIASEDAVIFDPHLAINLVPGDGIQIALRSAMGLKRANYAMWTSELIDAEAALRYGLVSEVVPKSEIYDRARELGEMLAMKPRTVRRLATDVLRAPLRQAMARELRGSLGVEMFAVLATELPNGVQAEEKVGSIMSETSSQ